MCGFDGIPRGNYFRGEPIGRAEIEVRGGKLKNLKVVGRDEIAGEMIKSGNDRVVNWIWRLYNIAFESDVPGDRRSAIIVPLYKGKGEKTEYNNYRGITFLNVVGKIYAGILVDRVRRVTGSLRGERCVDQIFTLKQIGEKA